MKQPEDNRTMELTLPGLAPTNMSLTPSKQVDVYSFHITTNSGEVVEWRGLTMRQAKAMYASTEKRLPDNVRSYGWEVSN